MLMIILLILVIIILIVLASLVFFFTFDAFSKFKEHENDLIFLTFSILFFVIGCSIIYLILSLIFAIA